MPFPNAGRALALAFLAAASPALAQMPPPAPMLHSKIIDDCGPKPLSGELCRLPVAFEADEAVLEGSVEEGMVPLSTRRPLWGAAFRLTEIDRAVLELKLRGHPGAEAVYRGTNAPPAPPRSAALAGKLDALEVKSVALGARRGPRS